MMRRTLPVVSWDRLISRKDAEAQGRIAAKIARRRKRGEWVWDRVGAVSAVLPV
jgi:hypothetical protein